ncbi:MAG: M20/M25/M40 family metallo-hydrolase, partial [Planctomycetes bacterium]|nr:M20/M25/M40 family metallo-hydrolase [Planctomycetota bacterium]
MKRRNIVNIIMRPLLVVVLFSPAIAEAANRADAISRVGEDIRYLASDELEGRGPATEGLEKAAEHITKRFKQLKLTSGAKDGSYRQPFEIAIDTKVVEAKTMLVLSGPNNQTITLELGKDFQPLATGAAGNAKAEVVFAGYGISAPKLKYDDYKDADVAGKIVLLIRREPQQDDPKSVFNGKKVTTHSYIRTKLLAAKKQKAAAVLLVNDPFSTKQKKKDQLTTPAGFGTNPLGVPFAHVSQAIVNKLLESSPIRAGDGAQLKSVATIEEKIDDALVPMTQSLTGWTAEFKCSFEKVKATVSNVVGVLEGEGPLANETIVIGAHYDHLGYGPFGSRRPNERAIHNGADDNATGTAAIMEIARRFAERDEKPARRMVFIAFSAEERGLIGSNYYLANPLFPLKDTVAMINFDMVGRLGDKGLSVGGVKTAKE